MDNKESTYLNGVDDFLERVHDMEKMFIYCSKRLNQDDYTTLNTKIEEIEQFIKDETQWEKNNG